MNSNCLSIPKGENNDLILILINLYCYLKIRTIFYKSITNNKEASLVEKSNQIEENELLLFKIQAGILIVFGESSTLPSKSIV